MSTIHAAFGDVTQPFLELASKDVHVENLNSRLVRFAVQAANIHQWMYQKSLVITSGNDGEHAIGSLHYKNAAVDLRSHDITPVQQVSFLVVLVQLGQDNGIAVFDERVNPDKQHYHCEVSA
jgi:hypothetical protein